jgi:hypothetical protein
MTFTVLAPECALDMVDEMLRYARGQVAKATLPKSIAERNALFAEIEPDFTADVAAYFEAMATRIAGKVGKAIEIRWDPEGDVDWTVEEEELRIVLARWYTTLGEAAFVAVSEQLGIELRWDLDARGVKRILMRLATKVKGICETSRELLRVLVDRAIAAGYSIEQLVAGVAEDGFVGLRETVRGWAGLEGPVGRGTERHLRADGKPDRRFLSDAERMAKSRARMIAATESANAYNLAAIEGYRESGLVDEVNIYDGLECGWLTHDDPDKAHGTVRTLDDAAEHPTAHPHCQRSVSAVVAR